MGIQTQRHIVILIDKNYALYLVGTYSRKKWKLTFSVTVLFKFLQENTKRYYFLKKDLSL